MNRRVFVDIDRIVVDGPPLSAGERAELAVAIRSHLSELMTSRPPRHAADDGPSRATLLGRDIAASIARQLPATTVPSPVAPTPVLRWEARR